MNKKFWTIIIALVIIVGGTYLYMTNRSSTDQTNLNDTSSNNGNYQEEPISTSTGNENTGMEVTKGPVTKEFTITGSNFSFSPNTITVNKGDIVKITFKDGEGFHNLTVDGYGVSTPNLQTGNENVLQFTADKSGTFQYYCSVDSHRAKGMVGTLVVN